MEQTKKKQFNILETSDPFSPEPLNQNTLKVEEALVAQEEALQRANKALSDRIAVFEAKHFAFGHFYNNGQGTFNKITLGFRPKVVFLNMSAGNMIVNLLWVEGVTSSDTLLQVVDDGFTSYKSGCGGNYNYLAFG